MKGVMMIAGVVFCLLYSALSFAGNCSDIKPGPCHACCKVLCKNTIGANHTTCLKQCKAEQC